jgi:hypothetical protein
MHAECADVGLLKNNNKAYWIKLDNGMILTWQIYGNIRLTFKMGHVRGYYLHKQRLCSESMADEQF